MSFLNNVKDDESKKLLLIVEDQQGIIHLLKELFAKDNLLILHTTSGREALELISMKKPDLVLLDLILPKKSGFDVLESISQDPELEKIPVIIISNLGQNEDIERTKQLGAIEYYIKAKTPIDFLIKRVDDLLKAQK